MDYLNTYPNVYMRYYESNMILHIDSNAAYLVAPKVCSCIAGFYLLLYHPNKEKTPTLNGAILVEHKTLCHGVSLSTEEEAEGIFHNETMAVPIWHVLKKGHPQSVTPLKTDNSAASGFVYKNIHKKQSKLWDMRYHWLRNCYTQQHFNMFCQPGTNNEGNYFTTNTTPHWSIKKTSKYVRGRVVQFLQRRCPARVCWYVTMTSHPPKMWHHKRRHPGHSLALIDC